MPISPCPPAQVRAAGRVAATVAALTAVSTGVVLAQSGPGPGADREAVAAGLALGDGADRPGPARSPALAPGDLESPEPGPARIAAQARQRVAEAERRAEQARARAERERVRAERERVRAAARSAARNALRNPRAAARAMLAEHGWSASQFSCLDALWTKESGWNPRARNPSSGAFGIPQSLPAAKMASAGADWATNPLTQIRWGLTYIADVYDTPCRAWGHSQATNWY